MKHTLFLTMMAAALLGGQVFAEPVVYRVSDYAEDAPLFIGPIEATLFVDTQKTLLRVEAWQPPCLTLDYQGIFELRAFNFIDIPDGGVLNITSTVSSVATAWVDAFSVEGGDYITLCEAESGIDYGSSIQFFGKEANNTVKLGDTEVKFVGLVDVLSDLAMNEVGVVCDAKEIALAGKVVKGVPEPATGSLSLLALAGLCARRRRK